MDHRFADAPRLGSSLRTERPGTVGRISAVKTIVHSSQKYQSTSIDIAEAGVVGLTLAHNLASP
jgi:hypothetical protein